jgi:hypothetical protein
MRRAHAPEVIARVPSHRVRYTLSYVGLIIEVHAKTFFLAIPNAICYRRMLSFDGACATCNVHI